MRELPAINMMWMGSPLGFTERLSILSFLRHGHPVRLHVYDEPAGLPEAVELVDASETVDRAQMESLRTPNGSYALGSDFFRYQLLLKGAGIWADCDMLCLSPIRVYNGILCGWETPASINSAILYLDPQSRILKGALRTFQQNHVPRWVSFRQQARLYLRKATLRGFAPPELNWGTYGPAAMTALTKKHGQAHFADPVDVFYPLPVRRWKDVWKPASSFNEFLTERSKTIHLWHSNHDDFERPPSSSAVGRFATELGL